ncbi:MAG: M81 family metallopeptidase [Terriglobia bacterium]|jgi:microcystin degradation protein MlrC
MRQRILVNECKQEISSFNPVLGRYEDYIVTLGEGILSYHRGIGTETGGALSVLEAQEGVEIVPGYSARTSTSAGTLDDSGFRRIAEGFLDSVRRAGQVDGVYFSLHGAMASVSVPDVEGYLLSASRKILGDKIPIVISLDLHGILTEQMLQNCNALTLYHTYPHVDFFETGQRAASLLLRLLAGEIRPVMARVYIPALVRGDELITATGLFGKVVREAQAVERGPGGLSAGMFIGNPFTDVPELGTNSIVIADGDAGLAAREALRLANDFWSVHEKLQSKLTSMAETVRLASAAKGRVTLTDAADATSSGASGDSNAILRALVEAGFRRRTLLPLVDAPAVKAAFDAGVDAKIQVNVGGALDPARFRPLPIEGRVKMLSDGRFPSESHGHMWYSGKTAVLESDNYTIVLTSRSVSLYDRSLFLAHGQDPGQFDAVVVKSPHCQPRFFNEGSELVINVDAPGATSANLKSLGHKVCPRPIFPLDENVTFKPEARVYPSVRAKGA